MSTPVPPPPEPPPLVRVVCVVFHPGEELATFARTLASASASPVELVIVDNGSDPGVSQAVADRYGARLVASGENLGYGGGANLGAAGARAPWILVANSDIEFPPGSLDALVAAGEAAPTAGSVGPALLNTDGSVYPSARELPSLTQGAGHALFVRLWPGNPWTRRYQARQSSAGGQRPAGWLSGACLLVRREAFEALGGFDDGYFMFFEDVDLGERLGRAGWVNLYVPQVQVTHVGGTSWRATPAPMISAHHASAARYVHRRYPRWYQWPVRQAAALGLRLRERAELRAAG
ncbi:glycosyltransferase family 2 protein [uncultured Cellulomonas sp.]|uniref:glycosyltransferase family 2 protein n=1 Tax=uncultured Cellulomonas sp. TaxID=189682 RepID=UPI0028ECB647|nr:glycosyltransferase family 2 protein [uncultured Cellulomonas sp.]